MNYGYLSKSSAKPSSSNRSSSRWQWRAHQSEYLPRMGMIHSGDTQHQSFDHSSRSSSSSSLQKFPDKVETLQLPMFVPETYLKMMEPFKIPRMIKHWHNMQPVMIDYNVENYRRGYALDYSIMDAREDFSETLNHRSAASSTGKSKSPYEPWWAHQNLMNVAKDKIGQVSEYGSIYPVDVENRPNRSYVVKRMRVGKDAFALLSELAKIVNACVYAKNMLDIQSIDLLCVSIEEKMSPKYTDHPKRKPYLGYWNGLHWLENIRSLIADNYTRLVSDGVDGELERRTLAIYHWSRVAFDNLSLFLKNHLLNPALESNFNDIILSKLLSELIETGQSQGFLEMYGASLDMALEDQTRQSVAAPVVILSLLYERANLTLEDIVDRTLRHPQNYRITQTSMAHDASLWNIQHLTSGLIQLIMSLSLAQFSLGFVHQDMHYGNIMISDTPYDYFVYRIMIENTDIIQEVIVPTFGKRWIIIDPGLSRASIKSSTVNDDGVSKYLPNTMLLNQMHTLHHNNRPELNSAWSPTDKDIVRTMPQKNDSKLYLEYSRSENHNEKHPDHQVPEKITFFNHVYKREIVQRSCETDLYRFYHITGYYFDESVSSKITDEWKSQIHRLEDEYNDGSLDNYGKLVLDFFPNFLKTTTYMQQYQKLNKRDNLSTLLAGETLPNVVYGVPDWDPYDHLFKTLIPLSSKHSVSIPSMASVNVCNMTLGVRNLCGTSSSKADSNYW